MTPRFAAAVCRILDLLGPVRTREIAARIGRGASVRELGGEVDAAALRELYTAAEGLPPEDFAEAVTGASHVYEHRSNAVRVESVWSGPTTHHVPVRATSVVLLDLIASARHELLLVTYAAYRHPPLLDALIAAGARGVAVDVVVETLRGAGDALGTEPARAFTGVPGVRLWHWPVEVRANPKSKLHAKLVIADRRSMLISSANLTDRGANDNIEAGVLITGGTAPVRACEHIEGLRRNAELVRLT